MALDKETPLEDVVRAIEIYSGLTKEEVERRIDEVHQDPGYPYKEKIFTAMAYSRHEFDIPTGYWSEVCELGRKLTNDDVTAFKLREKGYKIGFPEPTKS